MKIIQRTIKIYAVRVVGELVNVDVQIVEPSLSLLPPKTLRPENVIEPLSTSDTEKMGTELGKGLAEGLKRAGMPMVPTQTGMLTQLPIQPSLSLLMTAEEYEKLGKPSVFDELEMKIQA